MGSGNSVGGYWRRASKTSRLFLRQDWRRNWRMAGSGRLVFRHTRSGADSGGRKHQDYVYFHGRDIWSDHGNEAHLIGTRTPAAPSPTASSSASTCASASASAIAISAALHQSCSRISRRNRAPKVRVASTSTSQPTLNGSGSNPSPNPTVVIAPSLDRKQRGHCPAQVGPHSSDYTPLPPFLNSGGRAGNIGWLVILPHWPVRSTSKEKSRPRLKIPKRVSRCPLAEIRSQP